MCCSILHNNWAFWLVDAVVLGVVAAHADDLFNVPDRPALAREEEPCGCFLRFTPRVISVLVAQRDPRRTRNSERENRSQDDRIRVRIKELIDVVGRVRGSYHQIGGGVDRALGGLECRAVLIDLAMNSVPSTAERHFLVALQQQELHHAVVAPEDVRIDDVDSDVAQADLTGCAGISTFWPEPFLNSAGQANADVTTIVNNTIPDSAVAPSALSSYWSRDSIRHGSVSPDPSV